MTETDRWGRALDSHEWQLFYDCLAHGDDAHKEWLRGMVQGFATAREGRRVTIQEGPLPRCPLCECPYLLEYGCETSGCPGFAQKDQDVDA